MIQEGAALIIFMQMKFFQHQHKQICKYYLHRYISQQSDTVQNAKLNQQSLSYQQKIGQAGGGAMEILTHFEGHLMMTLCSSFQIYSTVWKTFWKVNKLLFAAFSVKVNNQSDTNYTFRRTHLITHLLPFIQICWRLSCKHWEQLFHLISQPRCLAPEQEMSELSEDN